MAARPHAWLNCTGFASVPVGDRPVHLGRSKEADFVLPHESVSRKHAIVAQHKGKFRVKNLSPLGLLLNGAEVEGLADIRVGDLITIGPFVVRVDDFPARAEGEEEDEATLPFGLPQRRKRRPPGAGHHPDAPTRQTKRPRPTTRRMGAPRSQPPRSRPSE